MFKKVTQPFDYNFRASQKGLYAIFISASCKSGKLLGFRGGQDLRVEIDNIKLREVPAKDKPQHKDIPSTWNGTELKGLSKTVVFVLYLEPGEHTIKFIPYREATIEKEPEIVLLDEKKKEIEILTNLQAEDGNCRPWITIALIDLPLKTFTCDATVKWRGRDSDDLKIIVDNKIKKNKFSVLHQNWIFSANVLKKLFQKERQLKIFQENLKKGIHYLEFWADRMPVLNWVKVNLGEIEKEKIIQKYTYRGVNGKEDYNRFDKEILEAVNFWNKFFFSQKYPPSEPLDPNLVKAIIYTESRMGYQEVEKGYYPAYPDVMQVWNEANYTPQTIREEEGYSANEYISDKKVSHMSYSYPKEWLPPKVEIPKESIFWGVRWLYYKAQYLVQLKDSKEVVYPYKRDWLFWEDALSGYNSRSWYKERVLKIYKEGVDQNGNILWGKENSIEKGKINLKFLIFSLIFFSAILGIFFFFFGNIFSMSKALPWHTEIIEKIQLDKNQYLAVLQDVGLNQVGIAVLDKKLRFKEWLPQVEISSPKDKISINDHFNWWKREDINKDGFKEVVVQLQFIGSSGVRPFYLYQEKDNNFNLLLFFDDGVSNTELKDLNGDGIEEIYHSFSLDPTGLAGRTLTPWKEAYLWKEGKYEKANHLFPEIYQGLLKTYDSFLSKKNNPSVISYQTIINCLKEKAQSNSKGVFGDGRECVKI